MFKKFRKVAISVAALALAFLFTANVAYAESVTVKPGKSGSATIHSVSDIYGIDGTIEFSNPGILDSYSVKHDTGMTGDAKNSAVFLYGSEKASGRIYVDFKVASGAKAGEQCVVTFNYKTADENGDMSKSKSASAVITVGETTKPKPTTKPSTGGTTTTTTTTPTAPAAQSDLTELLRLIEIANKLNKADYTKDSWAALIAALNKAKAMTVYNTQAAVDAAAAELQAAIDGLVKIDYTALLAAIADANALKDETELANLWNELLSALANANANLEGTSQEEVDAAAKLLADIVAKLRAYFADLETPVVAEPAEDCNVAFHDLLLILLIISVALNVILAGVLVKNKKNKMKDNTPMVKYSAADDDVH
ncbi:MAG: hypothetical protein IJD80_05915 [Oscillospiraceae bacterium]|nr:hypothetical protein [Oscillospiraceae bacterium]